MSFQTGPDPASCLSDIDVSGSRSGAGGQSEALMTMMLMLGSPSSLVSLVFALASASDAAFLVLFLN